MNTTGSFEINTTARIPTDVGSSIIRLQPLRALNTDAIETIDDIKAVLKSMRIGFSGDAAKGIEHLLGEEVNPVTYTPAEPTYYPNSGESYKSPQNGPHDGVPC